MRLKHFRFGSRTGVLAMAICVIAALVVAGCGGGSSSSSGGSTTANTGGGGGGETSEPTEGGELCVSSLVGYAIVPNLLEIWKDTAQKNGMEYSQAIADPEGSLQSAHSNLESCIRNQAKVAVNITTPDETLAPSISKLQSQGGFYIGQYAGEPVSEEALSIGPDDAGMSKQLFEYAEENLVKPGEKPTVLAITASEIPVVVARVDSFVEYAEEAGWNVVGPVQIPGTNVAQQTASKTAAALASNPNINMMLAFTDEVTSGAEPSIREAGAEVNILAYEGLEPTYSKMREGKSMVAAVASAPIQVYNDLQIWAVGQMLAGEWENGTVAKCLGTVVTEENVPAPNTPNEGGECTVNETEYSAEELTKMAEEVGK
jgi:ABC-type sugar transport system substrate-binding protein